jgi:hypothetical protein
MPDSSTQSSTANRQALGVYQGLAGLRHGFAATFLQAKPQAKYGSEDVFFADITPLLPRPRRG